MAQRASCCALEPTKKARLEAGFGPSASTCQPGTPIIMVECATATDVVTRLVIFAEKFLLNFLGELPGIAGRPDSSLREASVNSNSIAWRKGSHNVPRIGLSRSLPAVMRRCAVHRYVRTVQTQPGNTLDHADCTALTRQHEVDHTGQESICHERSRSWMRREGMIWPTSEMSALQYCSSTFPDLCHIVERFERATQRGEEGWGRTHLLLAVVRGRTICFI